MGTRKGNNAGPRLAGDPCAVHGPVHDDIRPLATQGIDGHRCIRDAETQVLVPMRAQVAVRDAPVFGQRLRVVHLEQFQAEIPVADEGDLGRDMRDRFTPLKLEAEHAGIPVDAGLEVAHAEGAMMGPEIRWAFPITKVTAIVSPSARPSPSMTPPMMPVRECGMTTWLTTSRVVQPIP